MKMLVKEEEGKGLVGLMGQQITVFCLNYIYTGTLIGVNDTTILLENPKIVYETGPLKDKQWKDAQDLPNEWYIRTSAIESFGVLK